MANDTPRITRVTKEANFSSNDEWLNSELFRGIAEVASTIPGALVEGRVQDNKGFVRVLFASQEHLDTFVANIREHSVMAMKEDLESIADANVSSPF